MKTPLIDRLKEYIDKSPIVFHMPGHKLGMGLNSIEFGYDVTEINGTDNLYNATDVIKSSQENIAKIYGAKAAYFLTNGSTVGIMTMLNSVLHEGDKVIIERNSHKSVFSGLVTSGAIPVYLYNDDKIMTSNIERTIYNNKDAKAILLTGPNYYGVNYDIRTICQIAHKYNMLLLVDAAHGAHYGFSKLLPPNPITQGADIVCVSGHKTMSVLGQGGLLLSNIEDKNILKNLSMFQTSSPSYLIMASIEYAVNYNYAHGEEEYKKLYAKINDFKNKAKVLGYSFLETDENKKDFSRICIKYKDFNSQKLAALMEEYNIYPEMADENYVVFISTLVDTKNDIFKKTLDALTKIASKIEKEMTVDSRYGNINYKKNINKENRSIVFGEYSLSPREAFNKKTELTLIDDAQEKTAGNAFGLYPPGIPCCVSGEIVTKEVIDYILSNSDKDTFGIMNKENNFYIETIIE